MIRNYVVSCTILNINGILNLKNIGWQYKKKTKLICVILRIDLNKKKKLEYSFIAVLIDYQVKN